MRHSLGQSVQFSIWQKSWLRCVLMSVCALTEFYHGDKRRDRRCCCSTVNAKTKTRATNCHSWEDILHVFSVVYWQEMTKSLWPPLWSLSEAMTLERIYYWLPTDLIYKVIGFIWWQRVLLRFTDWDTPWVPSLSPPSSLLHAQQWHDNKTSHPKVFLKECAKLFSWHQANMCKLQTLEAAIGLRCEEWKAFTLFCTLLYNRQICW